MEKFLFFIPSYLEAACSVRKWKLTTKWKLGKLLVFRNEGINTLCMYKTSSLENLNVKYG